MAEVLTVRCPTCDKRFNIADSPAMPFCSKRCQLIDLGRWLSESYSVPNIPKYDDPDEAESLPPDGE